MTIRILRKIRLNDGEQEYDKEEIIETKKDISFSIIRKYDLKGNHEKVMYLQIGNFLEKSFKEYEITEKDFVFIQN